MKSKPALRVGIQQRVLPAYRAAFFDSLGRSLRGGLSVFAGSPRPGEGIPQAEELHDAKWVHARNHYLGLGRLSALWQGGIREWLAAEDPQLIILEANPRYLANYGLRSRMLAAGMPVIGWSLGPAQASGVLAKWVRSYYAAFSALIVYSRNGADAFRRLGIPAEKIFTAPNAVESGTAEVLRRRPRAKETARLALGLDSRPVVLFVGRLQRRKRVDSLMRACARSPESCQLLVVGDGQDRGRLERVAQEIFPAARFNGDLRGEALGRCFLAADLFVLPGTGGLALQEAMLYGKPVAAAEADGSQRDLIREGENGWLLPPGDDEALRKVIGEALADSRRLERMGRASRTIVQETATMDKMVEGFLQAIRFTLRKAAEKP
jgi:glycosyltransferase involved in cell wall biosynthesis